MRVIDNFNHEDTCLVISDYPERTKHGEKNYGIAWYTKETLEPLARKYNLRFVVLAEKGVNNKPEVYANGKILVLRVFDPTHHSLYPTILRWLRTFSYIKRVYVHSEFCINGGIKNFVLLLPFLVLIKLFKKEIFYFAHNVIFNLEAISPHLGIGKKSKRTKILNFGIRFYYRLLGIIADKIIVLDEILRKRLVEYVDKDKVISIPIWVNRTNKTYTKENARKSLNLSKNDFVLLFFGFITWYKGADRLIEKIKNIDKNLKNKKIKLILAGGSAYSLKDKKYYREFYQKQLDMASSTDNISITGFVPEKDIGRYFMASDMVIFPYRGLIGSSGVLSYALSYKKPFVVSRQMSELFGNEDFAYALGKTNLLKDEMMFDLGVSFEKKITLWSTNKMLSKMRNLSKIIANLRDIDMLLPLYYEKLYQEKSYTVAKNFEGKGAYSHAALAPIVK